MDMMDAALILSVLSIIFSIYNGINNKQTIEGTIGEVTMAEVDKLWTVPVIAKRWAKHPDYVRQLQRLGLLRGLNLNGMRYRPEEVKEFEKWAEGKDLSDPKHIKDLYTGEEVPHRFAGQAEVLVIGG